MSIAYVGANPSGTIACFINVCENIPSYLLLLEQVRSGTSVKGELRNKYYELLPALVIFSLGKLEIPVALNILLIFVQ
jgi:hypothetical protein